VESPTLPPQGVTVRARRWRRARRFVALPIAALALSGCTVPSFGAHKGVTTESSSVFHLWQGFSIGAVIIGGFVTVLFVYAIIRFRRKSSEHIPRQAQYHFPAEVAYTVMPILVVFGLFAATLVVENKEVSNPKTNVTVDVNAFQWGWKFTYPGTETVVIGQTTQDPTMVIPVNTNIHLDRRDPRLLREGVQLLALRPARRAESVHARSGEDRQLLRSVHAVVWSLPFPYVL
jgi:uncharacterized membrane protein YidH (DUF202 family)